jgi:hypothetical protein
VGWTAFLDACVLYPSSTRDLLLRGAEAYLYRISWSAQVLEQTHHHLVRDSRCTLEQADSLMAMMNDAFPEASVEGYDGLIPAMTNHESDRHVLAAAVVAKADVIVTDNVRHFPAAACEPHGIEIQTADEFLSFSFDLAPGVMGAAFLQLVADWNQPALDASAALSKLDARLPSLAERLRSLPTVRSAAGLR